ncbi:hypothetical protein GCM10009555_052550 [Acrocarpospora macrocephala]|uniref:DUF6745 domain-containing protein n=1 Tax=Acrocarpospora macrocephala TaxID=150177 RepID=A0A5M3X2J3_9ACTN|nr:hypothetical protein [Acrocarpospora macrocephala]GES15955.1 hypothetical protein Amac_095530 [Acrocarpospora macrocephala]
MTTLALPPELAACLADAVDQWDLAAHATGPANRAAAEEGVRAAYRDAGLPEPEQIIWFASPAQAAVAAVVLAGDTAARSTLRESKVLPPALHGLVPGSLVRDVVRTQQWERVRAQAVSLLTPVAWAAAWEFINANLWPGVNRLVGEIRRGIGHLAAAPAQTTAPAEPTVPAARRPEPRGQGEMDGQVEALLRRATLGAVLGQHDAPWLAFFAGLEQTFEIDLTPISGLMRVAREAGWWWPFERVVLICERPVELHRDDLGRLHRAVGPALAFSDGFALHAWHGMPVPPEFGATMADLSATSIRLESNAELRRVMLEHYGLDRYLKESGAAAIHKDNTGVLWRAELADDEPLVMVEVINSTPEPDGTRRTYFLRVPPWVTSARQGVAWTFGLSEEQYAPVQQT